MTSPPEQNTQADRSNDQAQADQAQPVQSKLGQKPEPSGRSQAAQPSTPQQAPLRSKLVCPHCWNKFAVEDILWIARHESLIGDPILGQTARRRFRPSRFEPNGNALDAYGTVCSELACPRCHLPIPRVMLRQEPLFFGFTGLAESGKTSLLTSMIWELRQRLPRDFFLSFVDADPAGNQTLATHEETLFLSPEPETLTRLPATEPQGEHYHRVSLADQDLWLPKPFIFLMKPRDRHPAAEDGPDAHRLLVLYDQAGEQWLPGLEDRQRIVGSEHLQRARVMFFLFDPTQDPRFRPHCHGQADVDASWAVPRDRKRRQEVVLQEMAMRLRRAEGVAETEPLDRPLLVLVSKADLLVHLLEATLATEPFHGPKLSEDQPAVLDLQRIERVSGKLESTFREIAPNFVDVAEQSFTSVRYLPVSALGVPCEPTDPKTPADPKKLGVLPKKLKPKWATVPLLYAFARWSTGLFQGK